MLEKFKMMIEEKGYQIVLCLEEPEKESISMLLSTPENLHLLTITDKERDWHAEYVQEKPFLLHYFLEEKIQTIQPNTPLRL